MKAGPYLFLLGLALAASGIAIAQKQVEPSTQHLPWVIAEAVETVPFSFVYDGRSSRDLLPQWEQKRTSQALPGKREHEVVTWRDRRTGLEVIYERTVYRDQHGVDWVVRLHNTGTADTPILEKVRSLDLELEPPGTEDILLHQAGGGVGAPQPRTSCSKRTSSRQARVATWSTTSPRTASCRDKGLRRA
jgi:alpha-galactosidase